MCSAGCFIRECENTVNTSAITFNKSTNNKERIEKRWNMFRHLHVCLDDGLHDTASTFKASFKSVLKDVEQCVDEIWMCWCENVTNG